MGRRFMDLDEVAETLAVSRAQVYALVRTGRLRAIKIGGRGFWRVEQCALEAFVTAAYAATGQLVEQDQGDATATVGQPGSGSTLHNQVDRETQP